MTGEGVEEERGRQGKRVDGFVKTCRPLINCRSDARVVTWRG